MGFKERGRTQSFDQAKTNLRLYLGGDWVPDQLNFTLAKVQLRQAQTEAKRNKAVLGALAGKEIKVRKIDIIPLVISNITDPHERDAFDEEKRVLAEMFPMLYAPKIFGYEQLPFKKRRSLSHYNELIVPYKEVEYSPKLKPLLLKKRNT